MDLDEEVKNLARIVLSGKKPNKKKVKILGKIVVSDKKQDQEVEISQRINFSCAP